MSKYAVLICWTTKESGDIGLISPGQDTGVQAILGQEIAGPEHRGFIG
jgi:hypothetical protein